MLSAPGEVITGVTILPWLLEQSLSWAKITVSTLSTSALSMSHNRPGSSLSKQPTSGRGLKAVQTVLEHLAFDLMEKKRRRNPLTVLFRCSSLFIFLYLKETLTSPKMESSYILADSKRESRMLLGGAFFRPGKQTILKYLCFCLVEDLGFRIRILHLSSHQRQHLRIIGTDAFNIIGSMWSFPLTQMPWAPLRNQCYRGICFLSCGADQLVACSSSLLPKTGPSACFAIKYC